MRRASHIFHLSLFFVLCLGPIEALASPQITAPARVLTPSLADALQAILTEPHLARSRISASIYRLDTQQRLFAHHPDTLLVPASNVKLLTTAAALSELGPGYQFKTELYGVADGQGRVAKNLSVKGFGDPYLLPERIWYLASRLRAQGISHIAGDLVVDDSYFAADAREALGSEQDTSSHAYMAPAGALSAGFNALMIHVLPGTGPGQPARIILDPAQNYAEVVGEVTTVNYGRTHIDVDVTPHKQRSVVRVRGRIHQSDSKRAFWRRIDNPPLFAGEVFKHALAQQGIALEGSVKTGVLAPNEPLLLVLGSPRLGDLVGPLNRFSNNFMAAQLALVLGAHKYGAPATWDKAHRALTQFASERLGLSAKSYVLGNASGLHDVNRLSAEQMVTILSAMHRDPIAGPEFINSLAVAASSGTLEGRMLLPPTANLVRAKTGTLAGASALSGYTTSEDGVPLAFSILVNGFGRIEDVWAAQDRVAAALASSSIKSAPPVAQSLGKKAAPISPLSAPASRYLGGL